MSIEPWSVLCLFVAIYGKPNSPCNLFVRRLNSFSSLFSWSLLTFSALSLFFLCTSLFSDILFPSPQKSESISPYFPMSLKIFPTSSTSLSLFIYSPHFPSVQWRASGWSGVRGRGAVWLVTQGPSRGRDAAVHQCMAGLNVRAPIRRAENAPTPHAAVRRTNECLVFTLTCSQTPLCKHGTCII